MSHGQRHLSCSRVQSKRFSSYPGAYSAPCHKCLMIHVATYNFGTSMYTYNVQLAASCGIIYTLESFVSLLNMSLARVCNRVDNTYPDMLA